MRLRRTDQSGASQPWMRVADVEYAWLRAGRVVQQQCTVALSVVRQLSWDTPEVGSQIPLQVRMGDDVTTLHALVVAESLPSLVLGEEAMRFLLGGMYGFILRCDVYESMSVFGFDCQTGV